MKKILSILCAAAMLTVSSGMVYAGENNFADELEWGRNDYAVGTEKYEGETYTKGDWVYDKSDNKIVDYTGKGGDIVIPPNTTVSKYINIRKHGFNAYTRGEIYIKSLTVSENVTIEGNLISYDNPCKRIIFNNSIKQMPNTSLYIKGNTSLEYLKLPADMTTISASSFKECTGLKEIVIPDTVTSIENEAFLGCYNLSSLTLPRGLKSIGNGAFARCEHITSIDIPESVTSMGENVFGNKQTLKSISFGGGFDYTKISLPNSVEEINYSGNANMADFVWHFRNTVWGQKQRKGLDIDFYIKDGILLFYNGKSKTPVIPNTVKIIGEDAFKESDITSVTIPNSVTEIGDRAFYECSALKSVTIPSSVKTIGEDAFFNCNSLSSLTIEGTPYIYGGAFSCTGLTRDTVNIKDGFRYEGIEKNTYYDSDALIYFYPGYDEGKVIVFYTPPENTETSTYSPTATDKPFSTAKPTAKPVETAKPKPSATPKSTGDMGSAYEPEISEDATVKTYHFSDGSTVTAVANPGYDIRVTDVSFDDLPSGDGILTKAVNYLYDKGIVNGYAGNVFIPDGDITRAEIAKMLDAASENKSDDEKSYADVTESHWAYNYIKRSLYFEGYEDGSFKPEGKITYGEVVTAIVRFAGLEEEANKISALYYPENYIKTAEYYGITDGITVKDQAPATRGDTAIMLYNAITQR